jgi:hypothetical protein
MGKIGAVLGVMVAVVVVVQIVRRKVTKREN